MAYSETQAAEFKFESKFEPLLVIWQSLRRRFQKIVERLEGTNHCQAFGTALRHCLGGSESVRRVSTNTGRFRVGGSRCGQRPARLRKDATTFAKLTQFKSQKGFNALSFIKVCVILCITEDNTQLVLARLTPVAQAPSDTPVCKTFSTAWLGRRAQGGLVMPPWSSPPGSAATGRCPN